MSCTCGQKLESPLVRYL